MADLPALQHTFAASFHPVSPFMVQVFPDTPVMREWWTTVNTYALNDATASLTIAADTTTGAILGLIRTSIASFPSVPEVNAGAWSHVPLTSDHDKLLYDGMVDFMIQQRRVFMSTTRHCIIELLAVVHDAKGRGVGSLLLGSVCDAADREGVQCFVEANAKAVPFYTRMGFGVRAELDMPGGHDYREYILIREPKGPGRLAAEGVAVQAQ
jgi:GNAT superfamily N-acetyltransferase